MRGVKGFVFVNRDKNCDEAQSPVLPGSKACRTVINVHRQWQKAIENTGTDWLNYTPRIGRPRHGLPTVEPVFPSRLQATWRKTFPQNSALQTTLGKVETNFSAFRDFPLNFPSHSYEPISSLGLPGFPKPCSSLWSSWRSPNLTGSWLRGRLPWKKCPKRQISLWKVLCAFGLLT